MCRVSSNPSPAPTEPVTVTVEIHPDDVPLLDAFAKQARVSREKAAYFLLQLGVETQAKIARKGA